MFKVKNKTTHKYSLINFMWVLVPSLLIMFQLWLVIILKVQFKQIEKKSFKSCSRVISGLHSVLRADHTKEYPPWPPTLLNKETPTCSPSCPLWKRKENPSTRKPSTVILRDLTFQLMAQLWMNARQLLSQTGEFSRAEGFLRGNCIILWSPHACSALLSTAAEAPESPEGQHCPGAHRKHFTGQGWSSPSCSICSEPGITSLCSEWRKANSSPGAIHRSKVPMAQDEPSGKCSSLSLTRPWTT